MGRPTRGARGDMLPVGVLPCLVKQVPGVGACVVACFDVLEGNGSIEDGMLEGVVEEDFLEGSDSRVDDGAGKVEIVASKS